MIAAELFFTFLRVGAVSFGGGYGMIAIVRDEVLSHGWMTEADFLNFVAVAESTPGPLAVNMATFVGSAQGGIVGALLATLGVVTPSFLIILLIAAVIKNLMKFAGVQGALNGVRPAIAALVSATAVTMILESVFSVSSLFSVGSFDWRSLVIFCILALLAIGWKAGRKKSFSPVLLILVSAALGIVFYSF